ncbi:MAG: hypothetical protein ACYDD4_07480 [Acidimicrobiales bacterium]
MGKLARIAAITGVAAFGVTLASCSSGGNAGSTSSSTTSPVSQNVAADKALATSGNLQLSDLPSGWTSTPQTNDSTSNAIVTQLGSCLHTTIDFFSGNGPTEAQSPSFGDSNSDSVDSDVDYLATPSAAQSRMAVLQQSDFPSCFASAVNSVLANAKNSGLPSGASLGKVTVNSISFPSYGNSSVAYRGTVPVTYQGQTIKLYLDLVAARKGRVLVGLTFGGFQQPLSSTLEQRLTATVVNRLQST